MPKAPLPPDEAERLSALRASGLVEATAHPALPDIVARAAQVFGAPIATVSLVTETEQVFKGAIGLGVPHTSRDVAFCAHALLEPDTLVVNDAEQDPRFSDNALVTGAPGIRFYAAAPVFGPSGHAFGTLCVIDVAARDGVTPEQLASLTEMASDVSALFAKKE